MTSPGLDDLLKLPLASRGEVLRRTWPHPLDASLTGRNGVIWKEKEKAAIDIAALIVRAINSHCDPLDPRFSTSDPALEERQKIEDKTQLLRYTWYGTPDEVTEDLTKLQKQLCQQVLNGQSEITFERLIECGVMAKAFWSRRELLSWSLTGKVFEEEAKGWNQQKIISIPARRDQPAGKRFESDKAITEQLAYRSLLKWKWDGKMLLADFLTSQVKLEWSSADGRAQHQGIQAWPSCLRVRLDPAGRDDAPRFTDLVRIDLSESVVYRLLATVRLGSQGSQDFVRVYDSDCQDARPMATRIHTTPLPYVDNEWEVGQPGSRYMLYYVDCDPEWTPGLDPEEVAIYSTLEMEARSQIKAMREAMREEGPPPLPYGRITLTEPDPSRGDWEQESDG